MIQNMRQTSDNRWSGQVTDIRSGQTYSAHMSMRALPTPSTYRAARLGGPGMRRPHHDAGALNSCQRAFSSDGGVVPMT